MTKNYFLVTGPLRRPPLAPLYSFDLICSELNRTATENLLQTYGLILSSSVQFSSDEMR